MCVEGAATATSTGLSTPHTLHSLKCCALDCMHCITHTSLHTSHWHVPHALPACHPPSGLHTSHALDFMLPTNWRAHAPAMHSLACVPRPGAVSCTCSTVTLPLHLYLNMPPYPPPITRQHEALVLLWCCPSVACSFPSSVAGDPCCTVGPNYGHSVLHPICSMTCNRLTGHVQDIARAPRDVDVAAMVSRAVSGS
jgi:hypothetical protein